MAITNISTKEWGQHVSGFDSKVANLIRKAADSGKFGSGEDFDSEAFRAFSKRMLDQASAFQNMMSVGSTATNRAFLPYVSQFTGKSQLREIEAGRINQVFKSLGYFGVQGYSQLDTGFDPASSALNQEYQNKLAQKQQLRANIAESRRARVSSKFDPLYWQKQDDAQVARARAAIQHSRMVRDRNAKMSAQQKRDEIDVVDKGTTKALRRSDSMTSSRFNAMASMLALGRLGQRAGNWAIQQSVQAASWGQSVANAGLMAGTDPETIARWGFAMKRFGGSEADAAKLFSSIAQLRQGALMGESTPFMEAARKYGLNLTGSGAGGIATEEEILQRVAALMRGNQLNNMQKWHLASMLGMSAATRRVFALDQGELDKTLADDSIPNADTIESMDKTMQNMNTLTASIDGYIKQIADKSGALDWWIEKGDQYVLPAMQKLNSWLDKQDVIDKGTTVGDIPFHQRFFATSEDRAKMYGTSELFQRAMGFVPFMQTGYDIYKSFDDTPVDQAWQNPGQNVKRQIDLILRTPEGRSVLEGPVSYSIEGVQFNFK